MAHEQVTDRPACTARVDGRVTGSMFSTSIPDGMTYAHLHDRSLQLLMGFVRG